MLKLLIIPLIPIFVMLVRSLVDEAMQARREKQRVPPTKKKTAPEPKLYDHKWEDDNE
jgi:hypothetical protein